MTVFVFDGFETDKTAAAFERRYVGSLVPPDLTFPDEPGRVAGKCLKYD